MNIDRCFEILEIAPGASAEEAKQAYKDLVNIWHPDRFSQNPRLKEKAEKKLREINLAYERIIPFLQKKEGPKMEKDRTGTGEVAGVHGISRGRRRGPGTERRRPLKQAPGFF